VAQFFSPVSAEHFACYILFGDNQSNFRTLSDDWVWEKGDGGEKGKLEGMHMVY
jgi:hypothetical protein